jgi:segregation and condensation protein B
VPAERIDRTLADLAADLAQRGIRLQRHAGRVQFTTAPEHARDVEAFLQLEATARLSRAALEVLAIIAYRQPVTKPYVDSLRGVDSESSLTTLLRHGLIEESGRSEGPGRPILYTTTPDFLRHFGLQELGQLPPLPPEAEARAESPSEPGEAVGA